ncbi:hypothetical protein GCM10025867_50850 (plasmid) [Frondihabitans sucicola]|uniref:AIM24 family protein n=1 Tax=Frondihabitans sucicola TaxID=1268041 RepID=A0ABM8GWH6_9MICO|nr:hypothetical protein [Frondihabitans sucicola]BDZ52844.1 hypothetical protein GCM10025867_50850 [Frondihabitans sucicola]
MSTIIRTDSEIAEDMIFAAAGITDVDLYDFDYPEGVAATRKALRNGRGQSAGQIRRVLIGWPSVPAASDADGFELVGPSDGRPLVVENFRSPMGMKVISGHVILFMQSESGNAVEVMPGAKATIVSLGGLKTTVTAAAGSIVSLHAFDGTIQHATGGISTTRATVWGPREGSADVTVTGEAKQLR